LKEVFADAALAQGDLGTQDLKELASASPQVAQAILALYQAYRDTRQHMQALAERVADRDRLNLLDASAFPVQAVQDFIEAQSNHIPDLEAAAEALWAEADLKRDLQGGLIEHLRGAHDIRVQVLPLDVMGGVARRFDRHGRRILLSELLAHPSRSFHLAFQLALLKHSALLDALVAGSGVDGRESVRLMRIALASYFAGAVMMPYAPFLKAARELRYDLEVLRRRFGASFEQVCHRLTTLQRAGARGVPFAMIRVDQAGNVSKRFSMDGVPFARFGSACPRLNLYDAFRFPGEIQVGAARLPNGAAFLCLAREVVKPGGGYRNPPRHFALGLACELRFAEQLVYAEGLDLSRLDAATPIGPTCRLCERLDCAQRAFPPLNQRFTLDENLRGFSSYVLSPNKAD
jgi:predicted transcriptional regulator